MYRLVSNIPSKARLQAGSVPLGVIQQNRSSSVNELADTEIAHVGTTSANGDREIGELIAKAIESVGKEGVITVQAGNTLYNELEAVEGIQIPILHYKREKPNMCKDLQDPNLDVFLSVLKNSLAFDMVLQELEDPLILIHEIEITSPDPMSKITGPESMSAVLELALQKLEYPRLHAYKEKVTKFKYMTKVLDLALKLLIVAEDLDSFSVAGLIWKTPRSYDVSRLGLRWKTPSAEMKVITEERGMSLEKIELSMLGNCKKVIISKDNTILIGGAGDKKYIRERCEQIRSTVEASESDYDKGMLQDRLAKLSGSVAVIKIGGTSEREIGKKIDRVTDALNDTKAALEEGIVPGGGVALLRASKELEKLSTDDDSYQKVGIQIIQNALKTPVYTIASNAGVDGEVIVDKLLESDNPDVGYDAAKGEYVDMVKSGIIDPVKVIRTALVDAARDAEADFNIYNMATQIRGKKKFVADGVFYAELNKILTRELAEDGYVGAEAKVTTTEEVVVTEISKKEEASPGTGGGVGCTGDKVLAMNDPFQISPGDLEAAQLDDLIREIEEKSLFYHQEKKKSLRARYVYGTIFLVINLCAWFIRDYAQKALTTLIPRKVIIF
ncbi:hypothetical protein Bca52824_028661 [Brassica carinata]|uniref:Uncharacterized protein n=1 Tax=Brassica carinata TaxID=52824 RepID=A0A8X7VCL3_BRACI|nr:hypothetical protein Bca52824_028661 [Brassica carinata]